MLGRYFPFSRQSWILKGLAASVIASAIFISADAFAAPTHRPTISNEKNKILNGHDKKAANAEKKELPAPTCSKSHLSQIKCYNDWANFCKSRASDLSSLTAIQVSICYRYSDAVDAAKKAKGLLDPKNAKYNNKELTFWQCDSQQDFYYNGSEVTGGAGEDWKSNKKGSTPVCRRATYTYAQIRSFGENQSNSPEGKLNAARYKFLMRVMTCALMKTNQSSPPWLSPEHNGCLSFYNRYVIDADSIDLDHPISSTSTGHGSGPKKS
jgi:hypothetical protein